MTIISPSERQGFIKDLKVRNFFSLVDIDMHNLDKRKEIYLLGENGDGKSLILMALVLAFNGGYIRSLTAHKETGIVIDMIRSLERTKFSLQGWDNQKIKYHIEAGQGAFPEGLEGTNAEDEFPEKNGHWELRYLGRLLAYGVHRSGNDSEKANLYGIITLFDPDQYLINPERWLMNLYIKELEKEARKTTNGALSISLDTAKKILSDLLDNNVSIEVNSDGVRYDERGTPVKFSQLSEGYKSVITWVCDMVARLTESQPDAQNLQDLQGVVLVDEINLHLHPRWEKQIVKKLRQWFPKVQFFFTTHSAVTVLGASDDAVFYRVYKEEGVTKISEPYFKKDLKNLMANSILTSPLFGLEDARMESDSMT